MSARPDSAPRGLLAAAYVLTFFTGAAGLVYQVAWHKYLVRLVGSDSLATATLLGVFLGGLSLGYLLCGQLTLRVRNLFVAYGVLEAAIGLWALLFPLTFRGIETLAANWGFAPSWMLVLQALLCGIVLVGPPTLCMGGTVPMLTRALSSSVEGATRTHALVYAVNTAGACVGILAAGFVLVHRLGLPATIRGAALWNLAAAGFFLVAGRSRGTAASNRSGRAVEPHSREKRRSTVPLYGIALVGGFYFMTLETLLIRITNVTLGSSALGFSLVVAVMILCTALGASWVARRETIAPSALFTNQVTICVGLALLFLTLDKWPWAAHVLRIGFSGTDSAWVLFHLTAFALLTLLLIVPAGCMGATLPLAFDRLKRDLRGVGREAGRLFAWNALGSLGGGIVGGYLVFHLLGNGEVFMLALALAGVGAVLSASWLDRPHRVAAAVLAVAVAVFIAIFPGHDPLRFASGTFRLRSATAFSYDGPTGFYDEFYRNRTVLAYRDDPDGTFAVVENPRPSEALRELAQKLPGLRSALLDSEDLLGAEAPPRSILVNGKPDSSTFYDRETLRLAAHVPALLGACRRRVLVIGLGTGVTTGELTLYPDVESIEVAEISRTVVDFLPLFEDSTHKVQDDTRLTVRVGDAFRVLRSGDAAWDIVTSEPSNPWVSGVDQLFSREFYAMVRSRLSECGVFLQWVQRYATNERITAIAINTLRSEFPYVRAFRSGHDELLLASMRPVGDEAYSRVDRLLAENDALRQSLAQVGVAKADDLRAREHPQLLADAAGLSHLGIETLDHPRLHFLAGRAFFKGESLDDEPAAAGP